MTSYFCLPFILQSARDTNHNKTLIDNILFNSVEFHIFSGNFNSWNLWPFLIQFLVLADFQKPVYHIHQIFKTDYRFFIKDEFQNDLLNIDCKGIVYSLNSFNKNFNFVFKTLENLVDIHAPLKKLTKREFCLKTKPWIKLLLNYCRKCFNTKCDISQMKLQQEFKTIRNKVKFDIRESKKKYYESYFLENKNNIASI